MAGLRWLLLLLFFGKDIIHIQQYAFRYLPICTGLPDFSKARRAGLFLAALLEKIFIPPEAKEVNLKMVPTVVPSVIKYHACN